MLPVHKFMEVHKRRQIQSTTDDKFSRQGVLTLDYVLIITLTEHWNGTLLI